MLSLCESYKVSKRKAGDRQSGMSLIKRFSTTTTLMSHTSQIIALKSAVVSHICHRVPSRMILKVDSPIEMGPAQMSKFPLSPYRHWQQLLSGDSQLQTDPRVPQMIEALSIPREVQPQ